MIITKEQIQELNSAGNFDVDTIFFPPNISSRFEHKKLKQKKTSRGALTL